MRPAWLEAALAYADLWLSFQVRRGDFPGCALAVAHGGQVTHEAAFGLADISTGEALTPRHRFRAASHGKTFTACAILKLKEAGRLRLDDRAGDHVAGLNPEVAAATVGQLLSHSAGLARDGADSSYFADRRPFPDEADLREALAAAPAIERSVRFKYSNLGYGLLGLIVEAVTGEPAATWIDREVAAVAGLAETWADMPPEGAGPLARGHSPCLPWGQRTVIPADNRTSAYAPVTGLVATAGDLARFFAQLSPRAGDGLLAAETRRDMSRSHWPDRDSAHGRAYGLGVHSGRLEGWDYFGHVGRFQGTVTRTAMFPEADLAIAVLANAADAPALAWLEGLAAILRRFHDRGAPRGGAEGWTGRWWNLWGPLDLVAMGERVEAFDPGAPAPFWEASEIAPTAAGEGQVTRAPAMERFGERVTRRLGAAGEPLSLRIGDARYASEAAVAGAR